jgi:hypothetical protein
MGIHKKYWLYIFSVINQLNLLCLYIGKHKFYGNTQEILVVYFSVINVE